MRKVTVYTSQGSNGQEVETDVTLWGELQTVLSNNQISHKKMKAVVGNTRVTLESPQAQLPQGDFILFLMTKKNKSGIDPKQMSYKELRVAIKAILDKLEGDELDKGKKFFSEGSKNYTQTGTEYMRKRLIAWLKKFGTSSVPRKATAKKSDKADKPKKIKETKKSKAEKKAEKASPELKGAIGELYVALKDIVSNIDESELTPEEVQMVNEAKTNIEKIDARIAKAKEDAKANEEAKKKATQDMRNLSREFDDVQNM